MIERIARTCYRQRRRVVVGWVVFVVAISVIGGVFGGEIRNNFSLPGAESEDANDLLEAGGFPARSGETGQIVVATDDSVADGVRDPAVQDSVEKLIDDVEAKVPEVQVVSPYSTNAQGQINQDGDVAIVDIGFGDANLDEAVTLAKDVAAVRDDAEFPDGVQVELGGSIFVEQVEFSSEAIGFLAAMIILLIAFGSVLAMGLPLLTALFGILSGLALVELFMHVFDVPEFAPAAVAMISIGVGIDYALLIVTRYREELGAGREPESAVVRSLSTSGRAALFAGTTVIISMLSLLLFGTAITSSLAVAISAGVLMVMAGSLTVLPALLGFAGHSIDKLSIHRRGHVARTGEASLWYRWSRVIQRRPWPAAIVGLVVLLVLAAPMLSMRLGFGDTGNRPDTDTTRRAYDLIADGFGPGYNGPIFLAIDLTGNEEADQAVLDRLAEGVADDEGVAFTSPPIVNDKGDVGFMQVVPTTSPQDENTDNTVNRLRHDIVPAATRGTDVDVLVGGFVAGVVDFSEFQSSRLPVFIGAVLVLSFILLMCVFRSLLVPLKAVIMNMLSIGAAYGVIVAAFQWGWGKDILGLGKEGPIEAWAPMMLFAIVFGLSMDYEVFLLSRIKEEYNRTGDSGTAVADGLAATARVITAAAAIMIFVFGGFMLSLDRSLQLFGTGLSVAVLIDATIVRLLLVPATMELLGDRNWWIPGWIDRILPRIDVEGPDPDAPEPSIKEVQPQPGA